MTRRIYLAALLAVVLVVLGASEARAAPFTPRMNLAYRLAVEWWGRQPAGCSSVDAEIVPNGSLGELGAEATIPRPDEAPVACVLFFIRVFSSPFAFTEMCSVMVHEVGHLEGYEHSANPSNVMYPEPPAQPFCERRQQILFRLRQRLPSAQMRQRLSAQFWGPLDEGQPRHRAPRPASRLSLH